jgi:coenzyme PQQ precursor peptide PqqA
MKTWRKPKITEISVGCEINAYACAGLLGRPDRRRPEIRSREAPRSQV